MIAGILANVGVYVGGRAPVLILPEFRGGIHARHTISRERPRSVEQVGAANRRFLSRHGQVCTNCRARRSCRP